LSYARRLRSSCLSWTTSRRLWVGVSNSNPPSPPLFCLPSPFHFSTLFYLLLLLFSCLFFVYTPTRGEGGGQHDQQLTSPNFGFFCSSWRLMGSCAAFFSRPLLHTPITCTSTNVHPVSFSFYHSDVWDAALEDLILFIIFFTPLRRRES